MDHLNRCKTSIRCFGALLFDLNFHGFLFSISRRGTQHFTGTVSNEATSEMGYPAWPAGLTCNNFQFRQWQPAKPSTGMSFSIFLDLNHCTVLAI